LNSRFPVITLALDCFSGAYIKGFQFSMLPVTEQLDLGACHVGCYFSWRGKQNWFRKQHV